MMVDNRKGEQSEMNQLQDTDAMPFGKYRGAPMQDIPASYLHWLWIKGKREDTTCPVADYIRRNKDILAQEHPDGIWDVSPAHEQTILNRQDIARDFGDTDDVSKHWRGEK